jgi:hypothetical protein
MAKQFLRRAIGVIANQRGGALARRPRRAGMDISEVSVSSARTTNLMRERPRSDAGQHPRA